MSAICDNCGTDRSVRRAFITLWNGNTFDLCRVCSDPLVPQIDAIGLTRAQREQGAAAPSASSTAPGEPQP